MKQAKNKKWNPIKLSNPSWRIWASAVHRCSCLFWNYSWRLQTASRCPLACCWLLPDTSYHNFKQNNAALISFFLFQVFRLFQCRWSFLCISCFCLHYYQANFVSLEEMDQWKNKRVHCYSAFYSEQSLKTVLKRSSNPDRFFKTWSDPRE